jgi:hypothetical protein
MAQRIDVEKLQRHARRSMPETLNGVHPLSVPKACPLTLEEMLGEDAE